MADIKKISISGTEYDIKDATALRIADQGNLLPNFDGITPVQTIEFDTADSNYHVICTRTNTETDQADLNDVIYFRITVTGTSIHQVGNFAVVFPGRQNNQPCVIANMFPGTISSTYGGVRYLRYIFPKALNNGYGWALEVINNRNTTARHYKVEVFKTNSKFTWVKGTATTYNSTYQSNGSIDVETRYGYNFNYMYGTITQADNAGQVTNRLSKFINSTLNTAGAALVANSFVYQNGNQIYPASDKTKAIEAGFGIQWVSAAYNSGNSVGWDQIRQKLSVTTLTNIPHATLVRGNPCYFRCTMDSNGNILSDNYVGVSMGNGYTWYYIGVAQSATAIALDTSQSFFITLDSNGKLTHINGKQVTVDLSNYVPKTRKVNNKALSSDITLSASDVSAVAANNAITGATKCKITYDTKGLVTAGSNLSASDIPSLSLSKISDVTATAAELNVLDGITSTTTELNYTDGVTSNIQTQLNTKAADSAVVHKTGNETIAGNKTFSGVMSVNNALYVQKDNPLIYAKINDFDVTTNPKSSHNVRIAAVDKNETWVAGIYYNVNTSGSKTMDFRVKQKNGHNLQLGLGEKADGTGYTYCVEPSENTTSSTQIDTVGARNTAINTALSDAIKPSDLHEANVIVETYVNGTDWYRIWSDGWIEQGGRVSISQDTQTTVSLLKSFSDINYTVLITANKSGLQLSGDGNFTVEYLSTTQFKWGNGDDFSGVGIWYACGY